MRLTKHRKTILDLLRKEKRPLNAIDIFNLLPTSTMDLSTIYRSLDILYANHYISKSTLNQVAYYHLDTEKHHHYIICLSCHKMLEVDCHLKESIFTLEKKDFTIVSHDLTFYGYCSQCMEKENRI